MMIEDVTRDHMNHKNLYFFFLVIISKIALQNYKHLTFLKKVQKLHIPETCNHCKNINTVKRYFVKK